MAYKRKYQKGEKITSLDELMKQEFVYCHDKIVHIGWAQAWQMGYAKRLMDGGCLHYAIKNNTEKEKV